MKHKGEIFGVKRYIPTEPRHNSDLRPSIGVTKLVSNFGAGKIMEDAFDDDFETFLGARKVFLSSILIFVSNFFLNFLFFLNFVPVRVSLFLVCLFN